MKRIVNILSLSRIVFGLLFLYIVIYSNHNPFILSLIFILVSFTDYFDGKLVRKYNINNPYGGQIDVLSDFIFILLSTLSLCIIGRLTYLYLLIIIYKLLEFIITSKSYNGLYYERFGHFVSLTFYCFPIIIIVFNLTPFIVNLLVIFISICSIISSILRFKKVLSN